eukprot:365022-Chlamydomonas_euryale.AAC.8
MAGVPIRAPVAGISVGLLAERWPKPRPMLWQSGDNAGDGSSGHFVHGAVSVDGADGVDGPPYGRCALLLDIQGMEDALGDMDMKVAGTRAGLTALQVRKVGQHQEAGQRSGEKMRDRRGGRLTVPKGPEIIMDAR